MKIAYNPTTAAALTAAPLNNDITFDLKGVAIYAKGVKFKGTDTTYSVFKKHTSDNSGGYNGLVPVPSYNSNSKTRFLREDGTWVIPTNTTYAVVSSTANGLAPKIGTAAAATIATQADEWVLTSTKGGTPTWRKLPTNAFNNTNYYRPILVNGTAILGNNNTALNLVAGTNISIVAENSSGYTGKVTITNTGVRSVTTGDTNGTIKVNTNGTSTNVAVKGLGSAAYTASTAYAVRLTLTDQDLNNVVTPGFYNAGGGNTVANKPSGVEHFGLLVIHGASGSYYVLILYEESYSNIVWRRHCQNGTWSSWTKDALTDTHYTTHLYVGAKDAASNAATTNGSTYIKVTDNSTIRNQYIIKGSGNTSVSSDASGNITINSPTTISWGNVTDKPSSFTPATHYHSYLKGWSDTRAVATTPNDYNGYFKVVGIKTSGTTLGLNSTQAGSYATIIGWRGWSDKSGGYAWEIASTDKNRLYVRSGSETTWNNGWSAIAYMTDNYPTSQINKLTGYAIATSAAALATTDTLNVALGKLEYKLNIAYDLVTKANDGDGTIENLKEILDVLSGISDTETIKGIVGKYLPLTGGTLTGNLWFGAGNTDKYITFTSATTGTDASNSWRIGYLGTGSGNGNHFVLQSTKATTNTWTNALSITNEGLIATFASTVIAPTFLGRLAYTYLTGSGTTANLAIVSTGTANGWTLKTLGSRAFDSTAYLPLAGGTMTLGEGLKFHADENYFGTNLDARIISLLDGNGTTCDGGLIIDERCTSNGTTTVTELLRIRDAEFKWKGLNILHSGNSHIKNGVITINGTNITPLTAHQSLANYVTLNTALTISGVKTFSTQLKFTVAQGTSPFTVTSNTKVANLNADLLDGYDSSAFVRISKIANSTNLNTLTSNLLYYTDTDGNTATLTNAPYTNSFMMLQLQGYSSGDDIRRYRLAINGYGGARLFDDRDTANTGGTWVDIFTSKNYTTWINTTNFPGLNKTGTVTSVTVTGANGLSGTGTITTSGTITLSNAGVRSTTINGNYLRVNTNGTNADLTIPYATTANLLKNTSVSDPNTAASGLNVKWYSQISSSSGYAGTNYGFPISNNANGILWLGTHSGPYGWLMGFSSNGRIYARYISNNTFPTTANGGSWNRIAWTSDIPTVTNYYWANIKVSSSSSTTTTPTFATATATTSVTTPLVTTGGVLTLNGKTGVYLKYNNDGTKSIILNDVEFKPFDTANGKLDLGASDARWKGLYSVLGNFSGLITATSGMTATGNITLYNSSGGDSPHLIFQRGTTSDGSYDWRIYDTGGYLKFLYNNAGTWSEILSLYSNGITSPAFIKSGSSNSYVLLGGGGHKAESSLSVSYASGSNASHYLYAHYNGGQLTNPQTYFNNGIGVKVAMTGMSSKGTSYWSDTLWINGYTGGDVPNMCALHFNRDGTPRMFISALSNQATAYGTFYEVITKYNIASQSVSYATTAGTASAVTVTNSDANSTYRMVWHSGNSLYSTSAIYCNPSTDYLYATSMLASSWFRSTGATGWYSSTYGGGIYMEDSTWVRVYNGKSFYVPGNAQVDGTLYLYKTTDAAATTDNRPALIVGGGPTSTHIEMDRNEIIAKSNGTTITTLYLNSGGAASTVRITESTVGSTSKPVYLSTGAITACSATVGSSVKPVYMNAGTITACSVPMVRYWAVYLIFHGTASNVSFTKKAGNHNFFTSGSTTFYRDTQQTILAVISYPSGWNEDTTMIFGNGSVSNTSDYYKPCILTVQKEVEDGSKVRFIMSDDSTVENRACYAWVYFLCIG